MNAPRGDKRDVHGWIALDKDVGRTSTEAVAAVKRLFRAKKAGHAGTLDPLASGVLPVALGEATKTVPFVMDGRKTYRFTVRWGTETDTDDAEGRARNTSQARPSADSIRAALPAFTGTIAQVPPSYSALKIEGERAYDLARQGEQVLLAARPVEIHRLSLIEAPDADHAVLEAECGKGTYVRAIARDLGRALGCLGHVESLRRNCVGPFSESKAVTLAQLAKLAQASETELFAVLAKRRDGSRGIALPQRQPCRRATPRARPVGAAARPRRTPHAGDRFGLGRWHFGSDRRGTRRRPQAEAHL